MNIKKIISLLICITFFAAFISCGSEKINNDNDKAEETTVSETEPEPEGEDISGQTISYLCTYDNGGVPSTAEELFESKYGAKLQYIKVSAKELPSQLEKMILEGNAPDLVEFIPDFFPGAYFSNIFSPLDGYLDLEDDLWSGVKDMSDALAYGGGHYIVPLSVEPAALLQYNRTLFAAEGLEDPYELFMKGQWTWDKFLEISAKFVENDPSRRRYAVTGWFGQPALYSAGATIIGNNENGFFNNVSDERLRRITEYFERIDLMGIYEESRIWRTAYPNENNTLFYSMGGWSLKMSNAENPGADIFIVPFPKLSSDGNYYALADFNAMLLTANSEKQYAAARYLECERIAMTQAEYRAFAKEQQISAGNYREDQYDAIQSLFNDSLVIPVYDYGFGMGSRIYGPGNSLESRGAVNNISDAILEDGRTWEEIAGNISSVIDEECARLN